MRKMSRRDAPHQPPSRRREAAMAAVTLSASRSRRDRTRGRWRAPGRVGVGVGADVRAHVASRSPWRPARSPRSAPGDRRRDTSRACRGIEAEDAERGDHRGRPAAAEPDPLAPARAVAEAGRGDEVHPVAEAVLLLRHDHHEAPGQARDVAAAAAAGQAHRRPAPVADVGRVQVAEAVDLGAADEAQVDEPLLEEGHDLERAGAPEGARDVRACRSSSSASRAPAGRARCRSRRARWLRARACAWRRRTRSAAGACRRRPHRHRGSRGRPR